MTECAQLRHFIVPHFTQHVENRQHRRHSCATWAVVVIALLAVPSLVVLNIENNDTPLITTDSANRTTALSHAIVTPMAGAVFNLASERLGDYRPAEVGVGYNTHRTAAAIGIPLLLGMREVIEYGVSPEYPWPLRTYDKLLAAVALFVAWKCIDTVSAWVKKRSAADDAANAAGPVQKMRDIMKLVISTGRDEKDSLYTHAAPEENDACHLLIVWTEVGGFTMKAYVSIMFLLFLLGLDSVVHVLLGVAGAVAVGVGGVTTLQVIPSLTGLIRIAVYRPFYIGEIIRITTGPGPEAINQCTGFVEAITSSGIVLRNFSMKQTWIPHRIMGTAIIENWTRRPTKTILLEVGISSNCCVAAVKELSDFGMAWIDGSDKVAQTLYKKCVISKVANGFNLQIIFFPAIGQSHKVVRQEFLVAFMEAAERLQIPMVPTQITHNFSSDEGHGVFERTTVDLTDLIPVLTEAKEKNAGERTTVDLTDLIPVLTEAKEKNAGGDPHIHEDVGNKSSDHHERNSNQQSVQL